MNNYKPESTPENRAGKIRLKRLVMSLLSLFYAGNRNKTSKADELPIVLERQQWVFGRREDPFPLRDRVPVLILGVKDGWVRYDMGSNSPFRDERMEIEIFVGMYSLLT